MATDHVIYHELKEKAKWSDSLAVKKQAIVEMSTYGVDAIADIQEISIVTIDDSVKQACADAITAINAKGDHGNEIFVPKPVESAIQP